MESKKQFLALVNHPYKFRLYLLSKLPAAYFSGIKIKSCTEEECITSIPFKWLTQNPFRSTYFASLSMAAELSTGALVLSNIFKRKPEISSLVTKMEANYFKKATGRIFFKCDQGMAITEAVNEALSNPEGSTITVKSSGRNEAGEIVAVFIFTWSFRVRKK